MQIPSRTAAEHLLVEELSGEIVVYDLRSHRVHTLNSTAALVWKWCDGATPVDRLTQRLAEEHDLGADQAEALVGLALQRLADCSLLAKPRVGPPSLPRRQVLLKVGTAALLPVVSSMLAPTPAEAVSIGECIQTGTAECATSTGLGECWSNTACGGNLKATGVSCLVCETLNGGGSWRRTS